MEEAVNNFCDQINLTELEEEEILANLDPLEVVVSKGESCLLVKLLTNGPYNREAFKMNLKKI